MKRALICMKFLRELPVFLTCFLLRVYDATFEPEIAMPETIKEKFPAVCIPEITFYQ